MSVMSEVGFTTHVRWTERKLFQMGTVFFCDKCAAIVKNVIPRFLVKFDAMDDTGTCVFVFFDREFAKLAGCSAVEMIDRVIHKSVHHDDDIENETVLPANVVDKIVGKKFLCMVRIPAEYVGGSSTSCIVTRFTTDSKIIEAFEAEQDARNGSPTIVSSSHEDEPDVDMSLLDSEGAGSSVIAGEQVDIKVKIEKDDSANDEDEHLSNYLVGTSKKREDKAVKVGKAQKKKKFSVDD